MDLESKPYLRYAPYHFAQSLYLDLSCRSSPSTRSSGRQPHSLPLDKGARLKRSIVFADKAEVPHN